MAFWNLTLPFHPLLYHKYHWKRWISQGTKGLKFRSYTLAQVCVHLEESESEVKVKVTRSCPTLCSPIDYTCSPWNSPGQNTGVGSLSLLQGIFPTQGSNPGLPALQADSWPAEPQEKHNLEEGELFCNLHKGVERRAFFLICYNLLGDLRSPCDILIKPLVLHAEALVGICQFITVSPVSSTSNSSLSCEPFLR